MSEQNTSSEHIARAPILMPSEPPSPPPDIEEVPACSACGRQDETLRFVIYPFVFSIVFMTFRRAFAGLWCKRHRNLRLALASLITATLGWIGIPFGLLWTPVALFKLARGGDQPVEPNVRLLTSLAEHRLKEGDAQGAIRCLEAALQLRDDETIRERLSELYRTYRPPADERGYPQVLPFAGAMLGAAVVGTAVGVLDYVSAVGFSLLFGGREVSIYLVILSWASLVVISFIGGVILFQLIEWALTRTKCCQRSLSVSLAVVSASLALYGLPEGRAIGQYVEMLLSGLAFEPMRDAILTSGAVLTRGGVWMIWDAIKTGGTSDVIYLLILLACAVYYVTTSVSAAVGTVHWQQRIASIREKMTAQAAWALAPGWVPIVSVVFGLAFFIGLFPQRGIVDYFEAIARNQYGVELLEQGKLDEAIQEFQETIQLKSNFATAHSNLGWACYHRDEPDRAIDAFQAAIHLDPDYAGAHNGLGWVYYGQGELDQALKAFQETIRLNPGYADAHRGLGWVYYYQGELDQALEAFQAAIRLDPDYADAHRGLGWVYYYQDELGQALKAFQEAIRLDPYMADAHNGLGRAYFSQGNYKAAVDGFQAAIELNPNDAMTHQGLGFSHYWLGEIDRAGEAFEKAAELAPESGAAQAGLGLVCLIQDQWDDAETHLTTALDLAPDFDITHYGLGELYLSKGDLDKAVSHYQEAVRLNPQFLLAHLSLSWAYTGQAEFEKAVEQFETLIELQPDWGAPHAWLAYVYYQLNQLNLMEQEIQNASALQAEDAFTSYALAIVYGNLRRFSEAEAQLLKAIELSPDTEDYYTYLAYAYSAQKKFDLALQMCDKALELHEDYADAYMARGTVYIHQENLDQALEELSRALELEPEDEEIHSDLSFIYFHQGQTAEALKEAKEAVRLRPYSASGHTELAFAYHAQGQLDLALAAAQEAVRLAPKDDRPHYILGLCYMDKGEPEKAHVEFKKFLELYWDRPYVRDYKVKAEAYLVQLQEEVTPIAAVPLTVLNASLSGEPSTLDPALATDASSAFCDKQLFLGLTAFHPETDDVIPELAIEWSVSGDGLIWTFKMRDDVRWVNYNPDTGEVNELGTVNAHDVVYGIKRTLDPKTASDYAYVLYIIKGAEAANTGEGSLDDVGVKAVDDYTVAFTLEQPAGYFPSIVGMWVARPQPKAAIEKFGWKWAEPGNIITNGPYMLESWEHEASMVMVENPRYYEAEDVQIERIEIVIVEEASTAMAMYENNELDVMGSDLGWGPPLEDIDRIRADPVLSKELTIKPDLTTYYYGFVTTKLPFDNHLVRKAFSAAIDRQSLVDNVTKGTQIPAIHFAPPGIFGAPPVDEVGIGYDPEQAKAWLAEAGYPDGEGFPQVILRHNVGQAHAMIAQAITAMWKETLGVDVKIETQEWRVYVESLKKTTPVEDMPHIFRMSWGADYPDENNWVHEVFNSEAGTNGVRRGCVDPNCGEVQPTKFDWLTVLAAEEADPEKRKDLYREAERMLIEEETALAPIYHHTLVTLTKPWVTVRCDAPLGGSPIKDWRIDVEAKAAATGW